MCQVPLQKGDLSTCLPEVIYPAARGTGAALEIFEQRQFLEYALNLGAVYAEPKKVVLKITEWIHLK